MATNGFRRDDAAAARRDKRDIDRRNLSQSSGGLGAPTVLNRAEVSCAESATYCALFVYVSGTATSGGTARR
jgi:hypothetical protein